MSPQLSGQAHLVQAVRALTAAGVPQAAGDARALLAHALAIAPDRLVLHLQEPLSTEAAARFAHLISRRTAREPVSHLIGGRLFWGRHFQVSRDVLDPRPETEILIAQALNAPYRKVLDLGTGSGAIALTLAAECQTAEVVATDLSPAALRVATVNAEALGVAARVTFQQANWFDGLCGQYDLIVSNPPYIAADEMAELSPEVFHHEPHLALSPGGDGLEPYRVIAAAVGRYLLPKGRLMVEIGPTQAAAVAGYFEKAGLHNIQVIRDFDGRDRLVCAQS